METKRTRLRRLQADDYHNMRRLESDPAIMRFTPMRTPQPEAQTHERLKSQIEKQKGLDPFGIWLAEEKLGGEFVGWFMLILAQDGSLEIGFMLTQNQWGKGFATEIGRALIEFSKANGVSRITAKTTLDNFASVRVLEKLGFQYMKNLVGDTELRFFELQIN